MDAEQYSNALGAHDEDDEEDHQSHFVQGISTGGHHVHTQSDPSSFATHPDYGRSELSIDPPLNQHEHQQVQHQHQSQHSHPHLHPHSHQHHNPHPHSHQHHHQHQHQHQDDPHHVENPYGEHPMQRQLYNDLAPNTNQFALHSTSEQPPETSPPQFALESPALRPGNLKTATAFIPTDRSLPDKNVTDETLDDAYVEFILYCNPSVPLTCDTTELRRVFRQPPKSDGKTFNVYQLLQLIEKFERKDIKTWTKLAIELGVERTPDSSVQKVQQYAVRLKRWMHAMHVDAFFEYILNKSHSYYENLPPIEPDTSNPAVAEQVRDGVPLEEDLALRALHPETRPKRGRRRDRDDGSDKDTPVIKRQQLDTGTPTAGAGDMGHFVYPNSAIPASASADGIVFLDDTVTPDHWTAATHSVTSASAAATPTGSQQFRWRPSYPKTGSSATPHSPHPPLIPHHDTHPSSNEIASATPTSAKPPRRRRHGPAVSSAWPSSGNPLTGKLRGRPPSNRSVLDGPFSTFPVNPGGKGAITIDMSPIASTPIPTPVGPHQPIQHFSQFRSPSLHLTVPQMPNRPISITSPSSAIERQPNGVPTHLEWPQPSQISNRNKSHNISELQSFSKYPTLEELEQRLIAVLQKAMSGSEQDNSEIIEDANTIASKVFADFRRVFQESVGGADIEKIVMLTGATAKEPGFSGFRIQRLQSELEEFGLHDPGHDDDENVDDDARAGLSEREERRYQIRWQTTFGELKGEFERMVVLPPRRRMSGFGEGLAEFDAGDDERSSGGNVGVGVGEEDVEDVGVGELKRKVRELEILLRGKERELKRFRANVMRAAVIL